MNLQLLQQNEVIDPIRALYFSHSARKSLFILAVVLTILFLLFDLENR